MAYRKPEPVTVEVMNPGIYIEAARHTLTTLGGGDVSLREQLYRLDRLKLQVDTAQKLTEKFLGLELAQDALLAGTGSVHRVGVARRSRNMLERHLTVNGPYYQALSRPEPETALTRWKQTKAKKAKT